MSTDTFERELRSLLHEAADAGAHDFRDVDPTEVLGVGRRVVLRRRLAVVGGAAAAALVLGAGAWAVLDQSTRAALEPVPATRSTSAPSALSSSLARVSAVVPVEGDPDVTGYRVQLERATGRVVVTEQLSGGGEGPPVTVGTVPPGTQKAVWETLSRDPFTVVGVVPAGATTLMPRVDDGDVGGIRTDLADLGTTAYQAFVLRAEEPSTEADLVGLAYAVDGRVFAAEGTELPSAGFPGPRAVYLDRAGAQLGLVTPDGSAQGLLRPTTPDAPIGHLTTAVEADGRPTVSTFVAVLPIEAGDISVRVAPGATLVSTQERPLLGGAGVALIATVEAPGSPSPPVTGLGWVAEGRKVSWDNPG